MAALDGVTPAIIGAANAAAGGYEISRSLRFNDSDSPYLNRTPSGSGNRKTWTWSAWAKRAKFDQQFLFGAGSGFMVGGNHTAVMWNSSNQFQVYDYSGSYGYNYTTNNLFRDPSAWYHVMAVVDTTQSSSSDRIKLYVNGELQTDLATSTAPSQDYETFVNTGSLAHQIGVGSSDTFDGYLAEVNFVDGLALAPTDFGETDSSTAVWNPVKYSGSYNTNGFYLKFADNSSSAALGTDSSGNGNTWTPNNFSVAAGAGNDSLIDTPTNYTAGSGNNGGNYCTLNPLRNGMTLSNGNLDVTGVSSWQRSVGTIGMSSGKYYWEYTNNSGDEHIVGVGPTDMQMSGNLGSGTPPGSGYGSEAGTLYGTGSQTWTATTWGAGDIIGVAFDADEGKMYFYKNGAAVSSGNAAFTGLTDGPYLPVVSMNGTSMSASLNFGQRPFAISSIPSGYSSLVTNNLADPTITDGTTAMDVKLYTGTGSTQTISNLGFSPDLVWIKRRSGAAIHVLNDALRGAGEQLSSNSTDAETTNTNNFAAFTSDGFTVGTGSGTNASPETHVAWAWDAGTVTNPVGDIWSPGASKYIGIKFATASGGTVVYGQTSGTDTVEVWTSSDNSSWTQQGGTLTLATGHTLTTTDQYVYIRNTTDATFSNWYAAASNGADGHYSSVTYPSGASWSGPAYTDHDFREGGGTLIPVGSLNSSVYNQTLDISPNITTTSITFGSGQGLDKWFNGDKSDKMEPASSGSLDFTAITGLQSFSGTLQFAVTAYNPNSSLKFVINASTDNLTFTADTFPSSGAFPTTLLTIDVDSLETLDFTSISGRSVQFWGMYLDGKLLVDSSQTPPAVPSISSVNRANPTAGFSIVSYTGNGNAGATVGHGLNSKPAMIWFKSRGDTQNWFVYHSALGATKAVFLSTTDHAATSSVYFDNTEPTSSVFSLGTRAGINQSSDPMIAYCFSAVEGYVSVGSYIANGSGDGPFVFCGMRPQFIMIKASSSAGDMSYASWLIVDSKRDTINVCDASLFANKNAAEGTRGDGTGSAGTWLDILSNGFKIRYDGTEVNGTSSQEYIYVAFAKNPFKISRAR